MKRSGLVQRTERRTSRSVASLESTSPFAFSIGTARPGPDARLSEPGFYLTVGNR